MAEAEEAERRKVAEREARRDRERLVLQMLAAERARSAAKAEAERQKK